MKNTRIEWAHHTLNWWWGCEKVSEACRYCYAEVMAKLFGRGRCVWGKGGLRWIRENASRDARSLHATSKASGEMQRIFVNSMSDTFEDHPGLHEARAHALASMEAMPFASWLLLTKRPENVRRMVPERWLTAWAAHIWIGTTVENQQCAEHRIPALLEIPARVRFLSCEPLLGPLDLADHLWAKGLSRMWPTGIHWIICGGESGSHARPMHPYWARGLRDECQAAGIPFHFKQWGEWVNCLDAGDLKGKEQRHVMADGSDYFPGNFESALCSMAKCGKEAAGRVLDGRTWDEAPVQV